jgi:hypothetical protein
MSSGVVIGDTAGKLEAPYRTAFRPRRPSELADFRSVIALWEENAMRAQQPYRKGHAGYVSEFEQFMEGYLHNRPAVEKDQQFGWYLLWDKHVNQDAIKKEHEDSVPVKSYYYD